MLALTASCVVNADHVDVPKITFYLPLLEQLPSCSIPFPVLNRTCEKASKETLSFNSGYATLLNLALVRKLILRVIHGMFLRFESQAHTHVSHLEALPGDGREILRTINSVIYTMPVLLFSTVRKERKPPYTLCIQDDCN